MAGEVPGPADGEATSLAGALGEPAETVAGGDWVEIGAGVDGDGTGAHALATATVPQSTSDRQRITIGPCAFRPP
jgi:hypothetical protein